MAQMKINFMSYTLGHPVDIELVLPTISACDLDPGKDHSHRVRAKYPVLYLLHGHGNDAECWMRYTSAQRYAEEHRIAAVSMSVGNICYLNADAFMRLSKKSFRNFSVRIFLSPGVGRIPTYAAIPWAATARCSMLCPRRNSTRRPGSSLRRPISAVSGSATASRNPSSPKS